MRKNPEAMVALAGALIILIAHDTMAATGKCSLLPLPKGTLYEGAKYMDVRKKLFAAGYEPAARRSRYLYCDPGGDIPRVIQLCAAMPDVEDCSGSGQGYCTLVVRDKLGNMLQIFTAGDGDPRRDRVWSWHLFCKGTPRP
jgi:hypothetical protein